MKTPELILEQVFLKEKNAAGLPPDEVAASAEAIDLSNKEILQAYPVDLVKQAVEAKMKAGKRASGQATVAPAPKNGTRSARAGTLAFPRQKALAWAAAACCLLAVTFLSVNVSRISGRAAGPDDGLIPSLNGVRIKGNGPQLKVYKKEGTNAIPLETMTRVAENDMLQLSYIAGGDSYGAILSVDGNGVVTQHFPDSGDLTAKLETSGEVSLSFSYKLDDAPKFERFIFISSRQQFSISELKKTLSRSAVQNADGEFTITDRLPGQAHAADILLRK